MEGKSRIERWSTYPDVPNEISETKRDIKDVDDISVKVCRADWENFSPLEECNDMGDTNRNKLDVAIDIEKSN